MAIGGEGSVAANGFWAALNITTTMGYPLLFFIEDNQYGLSVPSLCQTPGGNIAANLSAYENLKSMDADGTDPLAAWKAIEDAVDFIRSEGGPCLLRMRVPRIMGHTFVDTQTYKSDEQRLDEVSRDPIPRLKAFLIEQGFLDQAGWQELEKGVDQELQHALEIAEDTPEPASDTVLDHVYYSGITQSQGGLRPDQCLFTTWRTHASPAGCPDQYDRCHPPYSGSRDGKESTYPRLR